MISRNEVVLRLQGAEALRQQLEVMDRAMQVLTPEDRLLLERMVLHPAKGNAQLLCQMLEIEPATVYRRKNRALDRLRRVLGEAKGKNPNI